MSYGNTNKSGTGTFYHLVVDSEGRQQVVGAAADDAAASGAPVLIGGKYEATLNQVEDGDAAAIKTDQYGRLYVVRSSASGASATQVTADGDIKASGGLLYGIIAGFAGVTAGDTVVLKDGSTEVFRIVASAANETVVIMFNQPIQFITSITVDITKSGGTMHVTGIYE